MYRGMSDETILEAAVDVDDDDEALFVLTDFSGDAAMNRWPLGHSYSTPMNTFTVKPISSPEKENNLVIKCTVD
jgi:hypothetical protein